MLDEINKEEARQREKKAKELEDMRVRQEEQRKAEAEAELADNLTYFDNELANL